MLRAGSAREVVADRGAEVSARDRVRVYRDQVFGDSTLSARRLREHALMQFVQRLRDIGCVSRGVAGFGELDGTLPGDLGESQRDQVGDVLGAAAARQVVAREHPELLAGRGFDADRMELRERVEDPLLTAAQVRVVPVIASIARCKSRNRPSRSRSAAWSWRPCTYWYMTLGI